MGISRIKGYVQLYLKNIPEQVSIALAMDLRKATSSDEMQNIINIYLHDHRTGLPKGTPGPMICMAEQTTPQT